MACRVPTSWKFVKKNPCREKSGNLKISENIRAKINQGIDFSEVIKPEINYFQETPQCLEMLIQQSLPSADPLTGGHLPWADIFLMYELLSNLIQPLMNGHLLNADRDSA